MNTSTLTPIRARFFGTVPGPPGPQSQTPGPPGPTATSVVNAAALTALSTVGFQPYGTTVGVTTLQSIFLYEPASTATPDGTNIIAAQGGGNWVSIFSQVNPGVVGTTYTLDGLNGVSNFISGWTGIAAPGQTVPLYTIPSPNLSTGEQADLFVTVDVQSAQTPLLVTGATGSGVPVVLQVASTAGVVPGSMVSSSSVGGNLAANGGFLATPTDPTHLALSFPGGGTPNGTGAWTSGGVIVFQDFGSWTRKITVRNVGGTLCVNAAGGTSDLDLTGIAAPGNMGASLAGTAVRVAIVGSTLQVILDATLTPVPVQGSVAGTWIRRAVAGVGAPPTLTSALDGQGLNHGPASGGTELSPNGTINLIGTNFVGAFSVTFGGIPAASIQFNSPTSLTVKPPSSNFVDGPFPIVVSTPNGSSNGSVTWSYDADPTTIFGGPRTGSGHLAGWWAPDSIQQTSGTFTQWNDKSGVTGGAGNFTSSGGTCTYNAASTVNAALASVTTDGTGPELRIASFTHGALGDPMFVAFIGRPTGGGAINAKAWIFVSNQQVHLDVFNHEQSLQYTGTNGITNTWPNNIVGTTKAVTQYTDGVVSASAVTYINVSNSGSPVQNTGNAATALGATGSLDFGGTSVLGLSGWEWSEIIIVNALPNSTQNTKLQTYFQNKFANTV